MKEPLGGLQFRSEMKKETRCVQVLWIHVYSPWIHRAPLYLDQWCKDPLETQLFLESPLMWIASTNNGAAPLQTGRYSHVELGEKTEMKNLEIDCFLTLLVSLQALQFFNRLVERIWAVTCGFMNLCLLLFLCQTDSFYLVYTCMTIRWWLRTSLRTCMNVT